MPSHVFLVFFFFFFFCFFKVGMTFIIIIDSKFISDFYYKFNSNFKIYINFEKYEMDIDMTCSSTQHQ